MAEERDEDEKPYRIVLTGDQRDVGLLLMCLGHGAANALRHASPEDADRLSLLQQQTVLDTPEAFLGVSRDYPNALHSTAEENDPVAAMGLRNEEKLEELERNLRESGHRVPEVPEEVLEDAEQVDIDIE